MLPPTTGILFVTMQPDKNLPAHHFHDWYNNEHGPTRLRLPFFTNGFRYQLRSSPPPQPDADAPQWMAIYDVTDMDSLAQEPYLRLREPPVKSAREQAAMAQISVVRKLYDFVESRASPDFRRLEAVDSEGQGNVIFAVALNLYPGADKKAELDRWYRQEHIDMMAKVPGWRRTRRYVTSSVDSRSAVEYLALHEFAPENGIGGPEFAATVETPWAKKVISEVVKGLKSRFYDLHYTFGPAPRHLAPNLAAWELSDPQSPKTRTTPDSPGGAGAIESWVTTADGVELRYRLEGSADPHAPLILLDNSILTTYGIWDGFVEAFFSNPENRKRYRIVRFSKRGRTSNIGKTKTPVTLDVLSSDIITILDALRVPKAAALIGVSLGGATVLNTALKYPSRVAAFVSCDTSSKSPAGNSKSWAERIAVAEKEGAVSPSSSLSSSGEPIVGGQLAELTTRRWFPPASYDGGEVEKRIADVKEMVATNSLVGFKSSVQALFEYDLSGEMRGGKPRGAFLVGGADGVLPTTMKEMASVYAGGGGGNGGTRYKVIDGAGHLPMVERPREFTDFVEGFLDG
jgi:pimeloyl-ACP methyl ester carboxylesterase